jgi:sortase A
VLILWLAVGCAVSSADELEVAESAVPHSTTTTTVAVEMTPPRSITEFEIIESPWDVATGEPGPEFFLELPPQQRGAPIGHIVVPRARIDHPIIYGVEKAQLDVAPGLMPGTAMPGQFGNSLVAGHRTTYGAPFHNLDLLEPGDKIYIETSLGTHTYAVVSTEIVDRRAWWVTHHRKGSWLTLLACHPKGSAAQRIIVFARLIDGPNYTAVTAFHPGPYLPPTDPALDPEEPPGDDTDVELPDAH